MVVVQMDTQSVVYVNKLQTESIMKKIIIFLLSLLTVFSCYDDSALRKQMQAFEDRLTELAGNVIAPIDEQIEGITASIDSLKEVDAELREYIEELEALAHDKDVHESELTALKDAIAELKKEDAVLSGKIADLQSYIDGSLTSSKDWAESTFSTLDHYESLQNALASLKLTVGHLEDDIAVMEMSFGQQLTDAISASESGMKTWVNEHLAQSYYDITSVDAKLSALEAAYKDADASLKKNLEDQQEALERARTELVKEYQKAIIEAIEKNNGVLDSKIADAVKTAQEALQDQIGAINEVVEALEKRLSLLETDFVNRIQSLVYIPEFTDGKVAMYQGGGSFNVKFLVTPTRLAADLRTLWQTDKDVISAVLYYAADPQTRSGDNGLPLDVTSVTVTSEGLLCLTVREDSENPVKEEFWEGEIGAFACIRITDGNNDKASELIALEGKKGNAFPDHTELPIPGPGTPSGVSRTANCYMISEAGSYTLKTVKGNSTESVGAVAAAEVLWESFGTDETPEVGDLIASVSYFNGRIGFTTAETFREGNAVVAAKDSEGNILWSWHIWFTDQPQGQVYYNNAGTMMDRNLGATSATPGDVGALGLLYQWGRKDPFLGSSSIIEAVVAASTITWPSPVGSDNAYGTIEYAVANPTTFIWYNSNNYDWYYTGSSSTDNTRWTTSERSKSIYDPCPAGWRIPDGGSTGVWAKALGSSSSYTGTYNSTNEGMNFSGKFGSDQTIWYPVSGYRSNRAGSLSNVGFYGDYWSASPNSNGAYYLCLDNFGYVSPSYGSIRADGYSVRCLKEGSRTGSGSGDSDNPGGSEGGSGTIGGNVDMGVAEDVAANLETANSYIVTKSGSYKFKAYKGNSQNLAGSPSSVDPVGEIAKAEVLWESFGTSETPAVGALITDVAYEYPYIGFKTADTFREGNAVIAVKDASDNILWSWHIWMTDYPQSQVYYNGAGTMMDRNLGATSATPGDVGALGLFYQWGRKDPFLGSSSISEAVVAASTITWPSVVASDANTGTIEYSAANPTTFITCAETNSDWLQHPDKTLWQSSKTMYDPCPVGWCVPDGDVWGETQEYESSYDSSNFGFNLSGSLGDYAYVWYPLPGFYGAASGGLGQSGGMGQFWSVTASDDGFYRLNFGSSWARVGVTSYSALGGSVRCMKEGSRSSIPSAPDPIPEPKPDPEPQEGDYVDEYGINPGQGIQIGETVWAPVNCGYHATDYKWGKLYQWGRKYGQGYIGELYDADGDVGTTSDAEFPELVTGPVSLVVGQSVDNAGKFYYNENDTQDWLDPQVDDLWNSGTEESPVKTELDPCPEGWRVPTSAELKVLCQNKSDWMTNAEGQYGYWLSGETSYSANAPQVFFSAAGGGGCFDGILKGRGSWANYWSSKHRASNAEYFKLSIGDMGNGRRANGYSVRCVRE